MCIILKSGSGRDGLERKVRRMELKQRVLLVVPHADDEIFVGGGLLKTLAQRAGYEVYVVYSTNSDLYPHEADLRLREALYVLTGLYQIEEAHIFFLGYGDGWQDAAHLYHQEDEEPLVSAAGRRETYALEGHADYRYTRSGRHSAYRRTDLKQDLKDVLAEVRADLLLVVDYDKHPDHRALSLLTEECLGELFREDASYRPFVLKRFAYDGVWKGRADFFELPRRGTVLEELARTPYMREEELRFAVPGDCAVPYLWRNFLYRALRCYQTQEAWQKADEIINIDEVFFRRNTDNLLYGAALSASSGNPAYLRDFKLFDCGDVTKKEMVYRECGWKPEEEDGEKMVRIRFETPQTVGRIAVYALGDCERDCLKLGFSFDTAAESVHMEIKPDGKRNLRTFTPREGVREMTLHTERWNGVSWGITELEILPPGERSLPGELQELLFQGDTLEVTQLVKARMKMEKAVLCLRRKVSRWVPHTYTLRRYYPELAQREHVPFRYRILYMIERFWRR